MGLLSVTLSRVTRLSRRVKFSTRTYCTDHCSTKFTDEDGDTLIEVLVVIIVLGLVSLALFGGFAAAIAGSSDHRDLVTLDTSLKDFAESATFQIQLAASPIYQDCSVASGTSTPNGSSYATYNSQQLDNYSPPNGFQIAITSIQYWNTSNSDFESSNCVGRSFTPQLITTVGTGPNSITRTLQFVVADPVKSS